MKPIFALLFAVCAAPALAACPDIVPTDPRRAVLMDQVRLAQNDLQAQLITNQLWDIWAAAPDMHAQEILDEGMQRRSYGDLDGADIAFNALIEYCPDYAEGYNQRAFVAFIRGEHGAAIPDLQRAIALAPDHYAALTGLALAQIELGEHAAGQANLRRALELNPWLPERRFLTETGPKETDL